MIKILVIWLMFLVPTMSFKQDCDYLYPLCSSLKQEYLERNDENSLRKYNLYCIECFGKIEKNK